MALQPLIPDPNQQQGALPTLDSMPMSSSVPSLPPSLKPLVTNPRLQQEQSLQNKINSYENPTQPQGFWHKLGHVAAQIGNVAGDLTLGQGMAAIPGTELNRAVQHSGNVRELAGLQGQDRQDATEASENTLRGAQTGEAQAKTAQTQQETNAPPAEPSLAQAYAHAVLMAQKSGKDPSQDPVVQHIADAITSLQKQPAAKQPGTKTVQLEIGGRPHQVLIDDATGKTIQDLGESGEKPAVVNVNAGEASLDREAKQFGGAHQKSLDASNAQLEKIADARSMINGNAEAQGLGMPKVLTALVGGQGTGVRITQAELQSIAHARGISGDVEGTLNKWSGKGALSKEQQSQLTQIMDDVKYRILQKQQIASGALDTINGASSRDQIIQADKDARQKLSNLETGNEIEVKAPNGKSYKFSDQAAADRFKQEAGIK